jgi:nitroimidazol reductase NimA-like FMN-containing flavoprotein (pyridoxamine 5'-phosphate oxidase superfamily)
MTQAAARSPRTTLRRKAERGRHDPESIASILDEAFVCHVAFPLDGGVCVIPTAYARHGDDLYLHGSTGNRMLRALRDGAAACICVTHVDGLVYARSAFHHSVNYRSVVLFGRGEEVTEEAEKAEALHHFLDHVVPGRWPDVRPPSPQELKQTLVLRFPITEASAKIRTGGPIDDEEDMTLPCWAGELPFATIVQAPVDAADLRVDARPPAYVTGYRR